MFFGEETVDLSGIYDDKKRKSSNVKGLINILKSYNFTVEENTPTDIEVALDPELLGKVFENLLASYNPETKTTARKQTGSFYTPREIVEYMVDESLKAHLTENLLENRNKGFQKLGTNQAHLFGNEGVKGQLDLVAPMADSTQESIKESLEYLFSYANEDNPFDEVNTQTLIRAIDKCRILDPACGSGAFPMGILQRLVFLLRKLDPENLYWRERQIKRATKDFETTLRAGQTIDLQAQIQEITETFTNNTDDYGRKLYLIENCIYGVDIQPIAVQIAKLRFFISLMAEQNPLQQGINRGIRPLPNLETKFVAANTLIGLEKPTQLLLKNTQIDNLENQLEEVRHKHFFARTPETKKKYRLKDQELRNDIAQLLSKDGWKPTSANQVAAWNPYDQSTYAPFFDPEWMFGIIEGFDIVIGNPPYVNAKTLVSNYTELRLILSKSKEYKTLFQKWDLYVAFTERGIKLLKNGNGVLSMIIPYPFVNQTYAQKLREFILNENQLIEVTNLLGNKVFEEATVNNCIIFVGKKRSQEDIKISKMLNNQIFSDKSISKSKIVEDKSTLIWNVSNNQEIGIKFNFATLGDYCFISKGMVLNADENKAKGLFIKEDLLSIIKTEIHKKPYIEAKNISKYGINKIRFLEWDTLRVPELISRPTFPELYERDKVIINKIGQIKGTFDNTNLFCDQTIRVAILWKDLKNVQNSSINNSVSRHYVIKRQELENMSNDISLKYLLAVLNSQMGNYLLDKNRGIGNIDINPEYLKNIPIPKFSIQRQKPFIQIVDYILQLKNQGAGESALMAKYFEEIVDGLVYELYFEEELHVADIYFHKYLQELPAIHDNNIATVFGELYSPQHPVRIGLFKLDTVEEVAIIEGKKK